MKKVVLTDNASLAERWIYPLDSDQVDYLRWQSVDALETAPDLLIVHLPDNKVANVQRIDQLFARFSMAKFVVMANLPDDRLGLHFIKSGAVGYCNAYMHQDSYKEVVEQVSHGRVWMGTGIHQLLMKLLYAVPEPIADIDASWALLSKKEQQVAQLLLEGKSNKQIAAEQFVAESTVKVHVSKILKKTGAKDRLSFAVKFQGMGNYGV